MSGGASSPATVGAWLGRPNRSCIAIRCSSSAGSLSARWCGADGSGWAGPSVIWRARAAHRSPVSAASRQDAFEASSSIDLRRSSPSLADWIARRPHRRIDQSSRRCSNRSGWTTGRPTARFASGCRTEMEVRTPARTLAAQSTQLPWRPGRSGQSPVDAAEVQVHHAGRCRSGPRKRDITQAGHVAGAGDAGPGCAAGPVPAPLARLAPCRPRLRGWPRAGPGSRGWPPARSVGCRPAYARSDAAEVHHANGGAADGRKGTSRKRDGQRATDATRLGAIGRVERRPGPRSFGRERPHASTRTGRHQCGHGP